MGTSYLSEGYDPPAAVAMVAVRDVGGVARIPNISMLLDTGSDISIIPVTVIKQLSIPLSADTAFKLASYNGTESTATVVFADIEFLGRLYRGKYVAQDQSSGIIGRDILNQLNLNFNGPMRTWNKI